MASPTLDFLSERFDPLEALYSDAVEVPYPQVMPLDNLAKCRAILPPELPESLAVRAPRKSASAASVAKHQYLKSKAAKLSETAIAEPVASALQAVFDAVKAGPLQLLRKWHSTSAQVKVVTRHCSGVRGTAVGTIAAFDRFMNLVLRDVEETYTVVVKVQRSKQRAPAVDQVNQQPGTTQNRGPESGPASAAAEDAPAAVRTRWCRKQEWRKRRLHQVFLKGDNVVLISSLPAADPDPDPTATASCKPAS